MSKPRYEAGGSLERVGESAASRPVVGGRWLIARSRAVALRLTEDGAQDRLVLGFDGALWGVAGTTPETGFALGRHGDLLIKFEDDGEALQSVWQQPLRNQRRRMVMAGDELLVFGGEDRVRAPLRDRRSAARFGSRSKFEETEGAASLSNGLLVVTNFRGHTLSLIDLNTGSTSVVVAAP